MSGRPDRQEGLCEEEEQAEPIRQHQQQGKEEKEELYDDEAEPERPDQRQTLLQREAGKDRDAGFTAGSERLRLSAFYLKKKKKHFMC